MSEPFVCALRALSDEGYRAFHSRLMPTVAPERVLGVRMPALRNYAKTVAGTPEAEAFLHALPHRYYEENNLHALLIEPMKDYDAAVRAVDAFLPYVDNWATCDLLSPKVFGSNQFRLIGDVRRWLDAETRYTVRFGLRMLMNHFLEEAFVPSYLQWAAETDTKEYYLSMMVAWYFATALAKQPEAAWPYFAEYRLEAATHRRAVQKALESRRIPDETKNALRALRRGD